MAVKRHTKISICSVLKLALKTLLIVGAFVMAKLANSISGAFLEWLERGGHKLTIKKNLMVAIKGNKRGVIAFEQHKIKEFYELDEYLSERYELFLKQWLNNGKGFVYELQGAIAGKFFRAQHQNKLMKLAKVA